MTWPQVGATQYHAQLEHTSSQDSCNQGVGCLLSSMAKINDESLDKLKVRGLVPCCGQDDYRAQIPHHPIDSYRLIHTDIHTPSYLILRE